MADTSFTLTEDQRALKAAVYELCKQYPASTGGSSTQSGSIPRRSSTS